MAKRNDIIVRVKGNTEDFKKKLRKLNYETRKMQEVLGTTARVSGAAFVGLAGSMGLAVKAASDFEQIRGQMQTLTRSTALAARTMKELSNFSAKTPFQFEDIANASKKLLAFGFQADQLTGKLKVIGDVSAAVGQPIGDVAQIFGQVAAAGKLTGERLLQFEERAVPLGAAIAKTMGISQSAVREMVSKGKVDFQVFEDAFSSMAQEGGIAFGGMEKQSKTFSGLISTLKDNVQLLAVDFGNVLLPALKSTTRGMISFLQWAREYRWVIQVGSILAGVATAFTGLTTATALGGLGLIKFRNILKAVNLQLNLVPKFASIAKVALASLASPMVLVGGAAAAFLLYFKDLRDAAGATFQGILAAATRMAQNIGNIFKSVENILQGAITLDFSQLSEGLSGLKDAGKKAAQAYKEAFREEFQYQTEQDAQELVNEKAIDPVAIKAQLQERREIEQEDRDIKVEQLAEHEQKLAELKQEYRDLDQNADLMYRETLLQQEISKKAQRLMEERKHGKQLAAMKALWRKEDIKGVGQMFRTLSSLQRSKNKTLFNVGKLAAIANSVVNVAQGVTKALSLGPIIGPALAASIGVAGAVQIAQIRSTTFQAKEGFAGTGSPFGESLVSTFTPREIVIPERFSEGIKRGEYQLQSKKEESREPIGAQVELLVGFKEEAFEIIEAKQIERRRLGVSIVS